MMLLGMVIGFLGPIFGATLMGTIGGVAMAKLYATAKEEKALAEALSKPDTDAHGATDSLLHVADEPTDPSWDDMRQTLQKTAYGMVGHGASDVQKMQFKSVMTEFAAADPMVREIVQQVQALVEAEPGRIQSKIYPALPGYDKEQVRYALYFAHELGLIHRTKKGSSYQLFPPGETISV